MVSALNSPADFALLEDGDRPAASECALLPLRQATKIECKRSIALVVDSDALIRRAAGELIQRELKISTVRAEPSVEAARRALGAQRAALLLVEASLLDWTAMNCVLSLRSSANCPIIVFVEDCGEIQARYWLDQGATAVLDRRIDRAGFCEAITHAARGERFYRITDLPQPNCWMNFSTLERRSNRLRPRQRQVLRMIASGARNRDIARMLGLCEPTVKAHVQSIFDILCVVNRTRAAIYAHWLMDRGLL